jgi:hypothetical protein
MHPDAPFLDDHSSILNFTASLGDDHDPVARQLGRIGDRRPDIFEGQRRITFQYLIIRKSGGGVLQNDGNHDSRPFDAGLAVANLRLDGYVLSPINHKVSLQKDFTTGSSFLDHRLDYDSISLECQGDRQEIVSHPH